MNVVDPAAVQGAVLLIKTARECITLANANS
jgi:hypothetical protein